MKVSVIICTWNRAKLLDMTLAHMQRLRIPEGVEWELIVVNNNCTDDTDAIIAKYTGRLPIHRLFEPKQGLSFARNSGVEQAKGELILFTDDDVLVDSEWLAEYVKAAQDHPQAAYFGGTIAPWIIPDGLHRKVQRWPDLLTTLPLRQFGAYVGSFPDGERPYGANMAFRSFVFQDCLFRTDLGPVKRQHIVGDETDLINRLDAKGYQGIWVGTAKVSHYVDPSRLTLRYYMKKWYAIGQTHARMDRDLPSRCTMGFPRWLLKQAVLSYVRFLACLLYAPRKLLYRIRLSCYLTGLLIEARRIGKRRTAPSRIRG
ncbi:MAG: hypothetical protein C4296_04035 [Gemmataceae bacterium]